MDYATIKERFNKIDRKEKWQSPKESSTKLQSVLQHITDRATAKKLERIYDLIHSSPLRSNTDVRPLEQQVISEIKQLEIIVNQNDTEKIATIADKIYRLADERNRQLKISNR